MKRLLPSSVALVVLAAAPVATTVAPASAAPKAAHHEKPTGQADKRLAAEQRRVATLVVSKDAALVRATRTVIRAQLTTGGDELLANIEADRLALADLAAAARAATTVTDVRLVAAQVQAVRPELYSVVANGLRQASRFAALVTVNADAIAALLVSADAKELEGFDVTAVRDALAAASLANDEAASLAAAVLEQGVLLTAFSTALERGAFTSGVAAAGAALDVVEAELQLAEDTLAGMVLVEEPVVEAPVV